MADKRKQVSMGTSPNDQHAWEHAAVGLWGLFIGKIRWYRNMGRFGRGQASLCCVGPACIQLAGFWGHVGVWGSMVCPTVFSHELCLVPGISIAILATCGPLSCYWGRTWIACVFRGQKILEKGNGKPKQRCISPFLGPWHLFLKICIFRTVCAGKHSLP